VIYKTKVRKIGNSLGVVLPKEAQQAIKVQEDTTLYITEAPKSAIHMAPEAAFCLQGNHTLRSCATYAPEIVKNHPFLGGNKRIGFIFLGANGCDLKAPEEEVILQTLALAAGEVGQAAYATWLDASCIMQ